MSAPRTPVATPLAGAVFQPQSLMAFVFNPIRVTAKLPYDLGYGCTLDLATAAQRRKIKAHLKKLAFAPYGESPFLLYEYDRIEVVNGPQTSYQFSSLPSASWRYYIVTSPAGGYWNHVLHIASGVTSTPLELSALHFHEPNAGWGYRATAAMKYSSPVRPDSVEITDAGLASLSSFFQRWVALNAELADGRPRYPEICRALDMWDAASLLGTHQDAQIIALFAILEMLITHNPELEDGGDSITRQLKRKIPLLARRFDEPLDIASYFGPTSPDKVWSLLYAFRSAIAHGGTPDFDRKLLPLGGRDNATGFIRTVIKALIRHAVKEPELVNDLKEV